MRGLVERAEDATAGAVYDHARDRSVVGVHESERPASGHLATNLSDDAAAVSYTHLRAHETKANLVCRLLLEKKKQNTYRTSHIHHGICIIRIEINDSHQT